MLAKTKGIGVTSVRIKKKKSPNKSSRKIEFNPSRNRTKKKAPKTSAVPGSGWSIMRTIGRAMMSPT